MIRPRVDPCLFWNLKLLPSSNYSSETTTRLALVSLNTRRHLSLGNSELRLVQSKIYSQMRGVFQSQNTIQNETTSRVGTISESLYPDYYILTSKTNNSHGGVAMRGELLLLRIPQPQMEARVWGRRGYEGSVHEVAYY